MFVTVTDTVVAQPANPLTLETQQIWLQTGLLIVVTIAGWAVVHLLSLRAQRKHHLLSLEAQRDHHRHVIMNDARVTIALAIADYLYWLEKFSAIVEFLWVGYAVDDKNRLRLAEHLKDKSSSKWLDTMLDYELLFPDLASTARELRQTHNNIRDSVQRTLESTPLSPDGRQIGTSASLATTARAVNDTNALYREVTDLKRTLQERVIAEVFDVTRDGPIQEREGGNVAPDKGNRD